MESKAHREVQKRIEADIKNTPGTVITSKSFLCWIHKEFYERMPEEYLFVQRADGTTEKVIPGEKGLLRMTIPDKPNIQSSDT